MTELNDLPVDFAELCVALEAEASDLCWYLDATTGEVILVNAEYDPAEHGGLTADAIESDPARFRRVPAGSPDEPLSDMHAFAAQSNDPQLRESFELALLAPRPERRFKAVLTYLPEVQDAWHVFRQQRVEERARAWLQSLGVLSDAAKATLGQKP
jgi:Uncharacterised protein family (UPF0158)